MTQISIFSIIIEEKSHKLAKVLDVTVVENEEAKDFDTERGIRYDINCEFDDGMQMSKPCQVQSNGVDF